MVKKAPSQSNIEILKSAVSQEQLTHTVCFLHADIELRKVKGDLKVFNLESG